MQQSKIMNRRQLMKTGRATINTNKSKTKDLLLCHPNSVAKSVDASFGPLPLACEASALTTELTAQNRIYFNPKAELCKHRPLASSKFCGDADSPESSALCAFVTATVDDLMKCSLA
jgi:hypothetical protein